MRKVLGLACILGNVISYEKRADDAPQWLTHMVHLHAVGLLLQPTGLYV